MADVRTGTHTHHLQTPVRTFALIIATALGMLWTSSRSVEADNTVTLLITPAGPLSAVVLDGSLDPLSFSGRTQRDTGSLHLLVSDRRGTSEGWSVTISASDFVYLGPSPLGRDIPSEGFRIVQVVTPTVVAGQPSGEFGPYVMPFVGMSLTTPRTVIWAAPGGGSGDYEQQIQVELDIPAGSQPGLYVATLTVAYTSAP